MSPPFSPVDYWIAEQPADLQPYLRLWFAVYADAAEHPQLNFNRNWFKAYNTQPGSFNWVCAVIGRNADVDRAYLLSQGQTHGHSRRSATTRRGRRS